MVSIFTNIDFDGEIFGRLKIEIFVQEKLKQQTSKIYSQEENASNNKFL